MTLPFDIPPWVPWWVPIMVLIPVILYALVLFVMPFSVIGVKGRLEALDERLDDIQLELRNLAQRLPEPIVTRGFEDSGYTPPPVVEATPVPRMNPNPPIPPAPLMPDRSPAAGPSRRASSEKGSNRGGRAEPRLDWPR